jgi:hypothetical protein
MKQFKFNHNDYVTVTLTKEGAEHLINKRKQFYDNYPQLQQRDYNYEEGDVYRSQFWSLINDFEEMMHMGMMPPFKSGTLTVESSLES